MKKRKILLIVPDGVGVRNYLYSNFITELGAKNFEVMLYHQITDEAITEIKNIQKNITLIKKIPFFLENSKSRLLRESLTYARLLRNKKLLNNKTIMSFWNKKQKGLKQILLYKLSEVIGKIISTSYKTILKFDAFYDNEIDNNEAIKKIENDIDFFNPEIILNLHQRSISSAPIINIAKKKKIKTATVIFSWDNVPKARLISRYDIYFVWSELMKNELILLYPEIENKQIIIAGTPQFEFYFNPNIIINKEDFFNKYGLDINKKTICFSANDQTSPYEQYYLQDLCEELDKMDYENRPQIIFRKSPVDNSNRFDAILQKYSSFVHSINPDWAFNKGRKNNFIEIFPKYNDFKLLANTIKHSDILINFGSTMAHDSAVYNKPSFYLRYNPVENSIYDVEQVYNFQHFKSLENIDAVGWIYKKAEIISKITQAIQKPDSIGTEKIKWMKKIVLYPLEDNSRKLANEIALL